MAGVGIGSSRGTDTGTKKKDKSPVEDMYGLYDTSVKKQAGDYDDIMEKFRQIYANPDGGGGSLSGSSMGGGQYRAQQARFDPMQAASPMHAAYASFNPMAAEQTIYNKSGDTTSALANLKELTETGGLSAGDQQNLRARGVSPIRAQYATATRDMDRQRRLQGGNSANFGAVTSKMARDQSSLIADQMDKVNANIAEMVQSGRLSAAPNYASAAQAESSLAHGIASQNTANRQDANKFNASGMFDANRFNAGSANDANRFNAGNVNDVNKYNTEGANDTSRFNASSANDSNRFNASAINDSRNSRNSGRLGAVQGMSNLYGTTPALSNLYGDQAHRSAVFEDNTKQRKKRDAIDLIGRVYGSA